MGCWKNDILLLYMFNKMLLFSDITWSEYQHAAVVELAATWFANGYVKIMFWDIATEHPPSVK